MLMWPNENISCNLCLETGDSGEMGEVLPLLPPWLLALKVVSVERERENSFVLRLNFGEAGGTMGVGVDDGEAFLFTTVLLLLLLVLLSYDVVVPSSSPLSSRPDPIVDT